MRATPDSGRRAPRRHRTPRSSSGVLHRRQEHKLERLVRPLHTGERERWSALPEGVISRDGSTFTVQRVIRRYAADAYMR